MPDSPLWKYCTPAHCAAFLLSLKLLGESGWPPERELACLYAVAKRVDKHYHRVELPKKDGTRRALHVPDPLLKGIQRGILHHVLAGLSISPHATAYHPGADIRQGALAHLGRPLLLKLDIRDFFHSIHFSMVYRSAFPAAYFPAPVRGLLTQLCCLEDRLPQGAPSSAAISNLVMKPFDEHMASWCAEQNITYTRYCDDMAFSGDFDPGTVERKVRHFLAAMGFTLNEDKTRRISRHQRQTVTGVVVNQKPQVSRDVRRELRREVYFCRRFGAAGHLARVGSDQGEAAYLRSLLGRLNHLLHINPEDGWFRQAREDVGRLCRRAEGEEAKP